MTVSSAPQYGSGPAGTRWATVIMYDTVTSTNDVAVAFVREQAEPHVAVTARQQTHGRGRLGRRWEHVAPNGATPESLAVTVTLPAMEHARQVPFAAALAAADTLRTFGVEPDVKWPNDLLLGGHKAVGILIERVPTPSVDLIVIGTGFNVDWRGVTFDDDRAWTSLAEHVGQLVDRDVVLARYLTALERWCTVLAQPDGNVTVLDSYRQRCATLGQSVTVTLANGVKFTGVAEALTGDGELTVRCDGTLQTVTSGDVWHNL